MGGVKIPPYFYIMSQLSNDTVGQLFMNILQHMKCIEVRLEFSKCLSEKQQKYTINQALVKTKAAIDQICGLLPNSDAVLKIKEELDKTEMVYVMLATELLFNLPAEDLTHITEYIDNYMFEKYGKK
jgi:hypothetical protein